MDFETIVKTRYATKKFDGKEVPQAQVDRLFEIIRHAPSSYNIQPWHIEVITDPAIKQQIQGAAWNQEQITSSSHLLVFCARTDIKACINELAATIKEKTPQTETYVQMMYDFEQRMNAQEKKTWAQRQVYLALSNAVNGAKALGFDSCPMEGFDPAQVSTILKLPEHIVPTALCPIGYAADTARPKSRRAVADVFTFR